MDDRIYWAHLAATQGIGIAIFDALVKRFGSIKRAMESPVDDLRTIPSLDVRVAESICRAGQTVNATALKIEELEAKGVRVLISLDNDYPTSLRQAFNPPPVIYCAGDWKAAEGPAVALIGSRECSAVSAKRAREYARRLAEDGLTIVSGYASGVDINAHLGALSAGGQTIIIPGCGADYFDFEPLAGLHIHSYLELGKKAFWLSEQAAQADWSGQSSLARNRLVAALAAAVIVVEAALNSSTLNTVERALALNRPVFAQTSASVTQRVMGNEKLLREGARPIQKAEDLSQVVALVKGAPQSMPKKKNDDPRR